MFTLRCVVARARSGGGDSDWWLLVSELVAPVVLWVGLIGRGGGMGCVETSSCIGLLGTVVRW